MKTRHRDYFRRPNKILKTVIIRILTLSTTLYLVLFLMASCVQVTDTDNSAAQDAPQEVKGQSTVQDDQSAKNILQIAISSKDHTTLTAAVQAADLEDVLVNAGPLTVFAPTNAAFDALPEGTVEDLLKPENKATLARIIKFHASPGKYMGDMFKDGMQLFQASGHYVKVEVDGDVIKVNGAKILGTVEASNGVVHVVDAVMLPPDA